MSNSSVAIALRFNDLIIISPSKSRSRDFAPLAGGKVFAGSLTRDISYNGRTHRGGDDGPGATASSPADKAAGKVVGLLTGRRR